MPAKAGIHDFAARILKSRGYPAFAGMTGRRSSRSQTIQLFGRGPIGPAFASMTAGIAVNAGQMAFAT
jgi:hypothetical protein